MLLRGRGRIRGKDSLGGLGSHLLGHRDVVVLVGLVVEVLVVLVLDRRHFCFLFLFEGCWVQNLVVCMCECECGWDGSWIGLSGWDDERKERRKCGNRDAPFYS